NVTNAKEIDELITYIPGGGRFLHSAFSLFSNRDIIEFFENLGIAVKEEDNRRMLRVCDKANTVVDALVGKARSRGVELLTHLPVEALVYGPEGVEGVKLADGERFGAKSIIVATGGKSVPHTGSTGDGYPWAQAAGHT
ncbi:FAD-binding protein, partial [Clostridium perfringens]